MGDTDLIGLNTRKLLCLVAIFVMLASFFFIPEAKAASAIVKIMPLGDSITVGYSGLEGYRRSLSLDLNNSGFSVDFVGSQKNGTGFDYDNEGHLSYEANEIRDHVFEWLNSNPADIVLLHIGTNDIQSGQNAAAVVAEVASILENINQWEWNYGQSVTVVLARIILRADNPSWNDTTKDFDNLLQDLAQTRIANGDKIVVVDMENALNYSTDMVSDGIHPNFSGYEKMADVWYDALVKILGYSLTVNYVGNGAVTKLPNQETYPFGAVVNLTAKADDGWTFMSWGDDLAGSSNSENITMDGNKTVTATFNQLFKLTITANIGSTLPSVGEYWYTAGTNVTIAATSPTSSADTRFSWVGWIGSGTNSYTGTNNSVTVTMNGPITQSASWKTEYKLTVATNTGTTQPQIGETWHPAGTIINAETSAPIAQTGTQYVCTGWIGTGNVPTVGTSSNTIFTLSVPSSISWTWKTQYYLAVTSDYGSTQGSGWYDSGTYAYAAVSPTTSIGAGGAQFVFAGWSGSASGSNSPSNAIVMDNSKTATAIWSPTQTSTPTPPPPTPTPAHSSTPTPSPTPTSTPSQTPFPTVLASPSNEPTVSPSPNTFGSYSYFGLAIGVISVVAVFVTIIVQKMKNHDLKPGK
jgi:uncharacterized repeat protein (TIGR02543 family)